MIYETAVVLRADLTEEAVNKVKESVLEALKEFNAEVLVQDDWGVKTFAQPTEEKIRNGKYIYFMYKADGKVNLELERRYRINEGVLKHIIVKLGLDKYQDQFIKNYNNPSKEEIEDDEGEKDKKVFSKRKSCYFSATKTEPDWKNPNTYAWLVNEFGKISPARITGLRPKFQRMATAAVKRGRCMGMISYMSDDVIR
jgi:ribosomal protein S18/ribosomal protein S6